LKKPNNLQNYRYIVLLTELLPFVLYLCFLRRLNRNQKVFFLYTFIIALFIISGSISAFILKSPKSYYLLTRIYNFIEFGILSYFFSRFIQTSFVKKVLLYSPIPFLFFCIYDLLTSDQPEIPFLPLSIEYIILLAFIIFFLFEEMKNTNIVPVYQKAIFWISVAFILNFAGNFFLFLYSKNSSNDESFQLNYAILYGTITIVKNILLCISAFINPKYQKLSNNQSHDLDLDYDSPFNFEKK
jgi:hypothetical protein